MGTPSVNSILSFSWNKTKALLFPFNWKRWLKILFIVWLAGYSGGGGGGGGNIPNIPNRPNQEQTQNTDQTSDQTSLSGSEASTKQEITDPTQNTANNTGDQDAASTPAPAVSILVVLIIAGIVLVLILLFSWLSARFNFIFLDLLTQGDVRIGEAFARHKDLGNSYFLFTLAYIFSVSLIALIIGGVFFAMRGLLFGSGNPLGIILAIVISIVFLIALIILSMILTDFVIPMMYVDKQKTIPAIKNFLSNKPKGADITIYFFVKLGVGILTGIAGATAVILVFLIGLIVFGLIGLILFLIGALLANMLPFLKGILIVTGILLLIPVVLILSILSMGIVLPIPVFFRYFSLTYLNRLIPRYNLLGFSSSQP